MNKLSVNLDASWKNKFSNLKTSLSWSFYIRYFGKTWTGIWVFLFQVFSCVVASTRICSCSRLIFFWPWYIPYSVCRPVIHFNSSILFQAVKTRSVMKLPRQILCQCNSIIQNSPKYQIIIDLFQIWYLNTQKLFFSSPTSFLIVLSSSCCNWLLSNIETSARTKIYFILA